jgi:transcriptional regulator with XRE-family HTH domain
MSQSTAAIVDPDFITSVRKKLDLDQRETAEIFGGDISAFSRYENGKTKPSLALVKLFKLLERHPDLGNAVRTARRFNRGNIFLTSTCNEVNVSPKTCWGMLARTRAASACPCARSLRANTRGSGTLIGTGHPFSAIANSSFGAESEVLPVRIDDSGINGAAFPNGKKFSRMPVTARNSSCFFITISSSKSGRIHQEDHLPEHPGSS